MLPASIPVLLAEQGKEIPCYALLIPCSNLTLIDPVQLVSQVS
jgi:hypothetical protein